MAAATPRPDWRTSPAVWHAYRLLLVLVAGSTLLVEGFAHAAHRHDHAAPAVAACAPSPRHTIILTYTASRFTPAVLTAQRCDILVLANQGATEVELAFGPHDHHLPYPGITDEPVAPGKSQSLVLSQAGTFGLHDHVHDQAEAQLTVKP